MGARRAGAVTLAIVAVAFRLCSIALCALVVMLCFSGLTARFQIVGLVVDISRALPGAIAGYGVISSPFGGVFRLDFTIVAIVFFVLDYVCARIARALR